MSLLKICAWCRAEMGLVPGTPRPRAAVTHGMCPACRERFVDARFRPERRALPLLRSPVKFSRI